MNSLTGLRKRRAAKAWSKFMAERYHDLKKLNSYSASDRIVRLIYAINNLDESDPRFLIEMTIRKRSYNREIAAIAEHMLKRCPEDLKGYFQDKYDSAIESIHQCNETLCLSERMYESTQ